jgi:Fe-Mn family superoxide dismutase
MKESTRREILLAGGGLLGAAGLMGAAQAQATRPTAASAPAAAAASPVLGLIPGAVDAAGEWALPPLGYATDAVEAAIDAQTMEIHHGKHHAGYVAGLKTSQAKLAEAAAAGDTAMVEYWSGKLSFNAGGHFLHCVFWDCMGPAGGGEPTGLLRQHIERDFGSVALFKAQFAAAAKSVEGSGWGILAYLMAGDRLAILQGKNQNLLSTWGAVPLLALDVWEHAYYLRYQNRRADYVDAWWNVVDWAKVGARHDMLHSH